MAQGRNATTTAAIVANVVVWGVPSAIYGYLWFSQIKQGMLLVPIGPLLYIIGLVVSALVPFLLLRRGNPAMANAVTVALLCVGIPFAGCGVLALGSF